MDTNDIFWQLTRGVRFGKNSHYESIRMGLQYQPVQPTQHQPDSVPDESGEADSASAATAAEAVDSSQSVEPTVSADELRRVGRIRAVGSDVPRPLVQFDELAARYGVSRRLLRQMAAAGYHEPTPVQQQAIPLMLERRELLVCAPTGSGKTAAYLVPLLHQLAAPRAGGCRALVVAPSRELARQIALEAARLADGSGLRVRCLDRVKVCTGKSRAVARCDLLVTTPNRLIFLLEAQPPAVELGRVQWLVVDESDKLFEAGARGFRDQLGRIYSACDSGQVRRALFSATFAQDVHDWCRVQLDSVVSVSVGVRNAASDVIDQQLVFAGDESGKLYALRNLVQHGLVTPCLIFVQTRERAKELFRELIYDGIMVDVIHAGRTQAQRDAVVRAFRAGGVWVLICTELMGRGIDFKGVNMVINYDLPATAVCYIHRVGRTGRAGRPGKAVTFFTSADVPNIRPIAHLVKNSGCEVPEYLLHAPKKSAKQKRRLAERPPTRTSIDTTPLYDKERFARIKALQKAQDRRKARPGTKKGNKDSSDAKSSRGKRKKEKFLRGLQVNAVRKTSIGKKKVSSKFSKKARPEPNKQ